MHGKIERDFQLRRWKIINFVHDIFFMSIVMNVTKNKFTVLMLQKWRMLFDKVCMTYSVYLSIFSGADLNFVCLLSSLIRRVLERYRWRTF